MVLVHVRLDCKSECTLLDDSVQSLHRLTSAILRMARRFNQISTFILQERSDTAAIDRRLTTIEPGLQQILGLRLLHTQ